MESQARWGPSGRSWRVWLLVAAIVLSSAAIRLRLLDVPLDRDEGEYAYIGQLLLHGVPPYARAYNMKMPGIYAVYALVLALFGESAAGVHLGLLVANAGSVVLLFLLARRLFGAAVGVTAAAAFAAFSLNPRVFGLAGYAEHFVMLAVLAGLLTLLRALDAGRSVLFLAAGLLFGLAFVVKQSGGVFVVFAVVYAAGALGVHRYAAWRAAAWRPAARALAALAGGALIPFAAACALLALAGTFSTFWFWAFRYAPHYAAVVPLVPGLGNFGHMGAAIAMPSWPLHVAAGVGLVAFAWDRSLAAHRALVLLFVVFSLLALATGFYFRPHYFVVLTPALGLLAGAAPFAVARLVPGPRPLAVSAAVLTLSALPVLLALHAERQILFRAGPTEVSRALYGTNPFAESIEVARYIRERTGKDDTILVLGSEPQIYFYAGRRSATGYIYMYPLMERHPYAAMMQRQMIRELEAARPKFLVFVSVAASWLATPESEPLLSGWFSGYWPLFERVGVVDILSPEPTRYYWDQDARQRSPRSYVWLGVYRRRADAAAASPPSPPR